MKPMFKFDKLRPFVGCLNDSGITSSNYKEKIFEYFSPDPIRSYSAKIRISSISKGLPENYDEEIMPDDLGGIDPPAELPEKRCINVNGREEHEAILKDAQKCKDLGVDQYYETIIYLKRWGRWLDDKV